MTWNPSGSTEALFQRWIHLAMFELGVDPIFHLLGTWNWDKSKQTSCNLPLVAVHHFCLTKGFQKTPNYSAIYRSKRHLCLALLFFISICVLPFICSAYWLERPEKGLKNVTSNDFVRYVYVFHEDSRDYVHSTYEITDILNYKVNHITYWVDIQCCQLPARSFA